MNYTKIVNGQAVELTDSEQAERVAEEKDWSDKVAKREEAIQAEQQLLILSKDRLIAIEKAILTGAKTDVQDLSNQVADLNDKINEGKDK